MTKITQLLSLKGRKTHSVRPDETVLTALEIMERENIGSLLVMDGDRLVGMFTERLYAREVFLKGKSSPKTHIREVMKENVPCVSPDRSVEECMAIMTEKRVRHLPVIDEGRVVGVISIGDLVKSIISDQEFTINQLEDYIRA